MNKAKTIHFVGIKGVGMTALALIAKEAGFRVTGSDIADEFITDSALKKAGITPYKEFSPNHIQQADLLIATAAHDGFDNIEVRTAKEKQIPVLSLGEALGIFMDGSMFHKKFTGISIAGTHGKTTTTAMIATIFKESALDPSYFIGTSDVPSLDAPGHFGNGKFFIAEADEYVSEVHYERKAKFLWQHPKFAIVTNIDLDHTDIYNSIDDLRNTFLAFAKQLPKDGILIAYGDDHQVREMLKDYSGHVITYGFSAANDYVIKRATVSGEQMFFWLEAYGAELGEFVLKVVGEHNVLNAVAAIITSLEAGIPVEKIKKALMSFQGSKRRAEYIGQLPSGAFAFDDYAHHPTEIAKTLHAFRQRFPKKKIICIFQPHTYSRTKKLFDDFLRSFTSADTVILTNIFASLRETPDPTISSQTLAEAMIRHHKNVLFLPLLTDVVEYIGSKHFKDDTVLITMGAGDIYQIHKKIGVKK